MLKQSEKSGHPVVAAGNSMETCFTTTTTVTEETNTMN